MSIYNIAIIIISSLIGGGIGAYYLQEVFCKEKIKFYKAIFLFLIFKEKNGFLYYYTF